MQIKVRKETPNDYRITEEIARSAFWNLYFPGCHEHYVIHQMRKHPDFIRELAFVIEVDGNVQGAIYYTHSKIVTDTGKVFPTVSFGPVFISPAYHRQGLGRILITHSIEVAKSMGFSAITTLGYPYHYQPYGFVGGKKYKIAMEDGKFYQGLLVLPLYDHALDQIHGIAKFSKALESSDEEVELFDQTFPYKEKQILPCQKEYEIACSLLDE